MVFPLEYISLLNIAVIAFFILYFFVGIHRGFLLMLIDLLGTVVMFLIAYFVSPMLASFFDFSTYFKIDLGFDALNLIINDRINTLVWFLVVFLIGSFILMLLKPIVKTIGKIPLIKEVNGLLGGLFGLLKAYILALVAIFVLTMPFVDNGGVVIESSILKPIYASTSLITSIFEDPTRINQILQDVKNGNVLNEEKINDLENWLNNNFKDIKIEDFIKIEE